MNRLSIRTDIWRIGAIVWTITIVYFSLINSNNIPDVKIFSWDKIVHAAVYFILVVLFIFGFKPKANNLIFVLIACILLGVLLEFLQGFMKEGRSADIADAIANSVGVFAGYYVCIKVLKIS